MEQTKTNTGLVYGVICGVAVIAFTILLYVAGVEWYTSPLAYVGFVIPIVIGFMGAYKQRSLQGGYLTFKEALKTVFIIFIISIVLDTLFSYLLLNVIDVPFREAVMQDAAVKMEKFLVKMGTSQDDIDKAMADFDNPNNFSPGKIILGMFVRLIVWFIVALIIAAIVKKKRPEFENQI
ncbi:MAG: DUF4199 domain-containing protein [Chitinophagaceae bacterium]|nr:MAG: DUF4199 domain-containing protein [Chitinophagaceae bacterium]